MRSFFRINSRRLSYRVRSTYLPGLLLAAILVLDLASIRHKTLTYDEPACLKYGASILSLDSTRTAAGPMPFFALNALPARWGECLSSGRLSRLLTSPPAARLPTILFSLLLAGYVFCWTRELYGSLPASFALFLYAFSPTVLAHSRLATSDLYAAGMMTISLYYFRRFINRKNWKRGLVSALAAAVSLLAKSSCLLLYPIFILIVLIKYAPALPAVLRRPNLPALRRVLLSLCGYLLLFSGAALIVINAGFLFKDTFSSLEDYRFRSRTLSTLRARSGFLKNLPLPLPRPYLSGVDWLKWKEESGDGFGYMYLFGELKKTEGFKNYFFFAFLYKVPLALQILIILSLVNYWFTRRRYKFRRDELFLLIPLLFLLLYFNFAVRVNLGIRYLLPVFPLFFIFSGSLLARRPRPAVKAGAGALAVYLLGSSLSYYPHFLSYFNEFVWDRKQAYHLLADSNIDWGQNKWYLKVYRKEHPNIYVSPPGPVAGRVVVSVNDLVGVWNPEEYRWLRENFSPVDHVAYSYLVFDIPLEAFSGGIEVPRKN